MPSSSASGGIFSFGEFEADLRSRELRRNGARVSLPDQAFLVLAILLERPGELVTREEIQKEIWPSNTFVDFDHGLYNAVNRLREALGDSAEMPRFVETLPRRGYRLLATVKWQSSRTKPPVDSRAAADGTGMNQASRIPGHGASPLYRKPPFWIVTAIVAVALLIAVKSANTPLPPASRSYVLPPDGATFNLINDDGGSVVLSPDGRKLAFVAIPSNGPARIWVRTLANLSADSLEGTEGATFPFWSPDGQWIAFFAEGKLKKIRLAGGAPITICEAPFGRGGSWKNGVIIFAPASHGGIYKVADSGGSPVQLTSVDPSIHTTHRWPKFLPSGRYFLYLAASHFRDAAHDGIYLASIDGGEQKFVVASESDATYASGFLFFYNKGMVQTQRFNPDTAKLEGELQRIGENVLYDPLIWKAVLDVSETGVMAYQLGRKVAGTRLRWLDRSGKELDTVDPSSPVQEVQLSRDGRKLVTAIQEVGYSNVWICNLSRKTRTAVTSSQFDHGSPIWTADGGAVVFASKREHYSLARLNVSRAGSEETVLDTGNDAWPFDISLDGRFLLYGRGVYIGRTKSQLWVYPMGGSSKPFRLLEGDSVETDGQFSPDGHWIIYVSNVSGREEVYVVPFRPQSGSSPEIGRESEQVSVAGGRAPRWRRDGKEIFYMAPDKTLMSVPVTYRGAKPDLGAARALFRISPGFYIFPYDVSADGTRFIVNTAPPEKDAPITLVENWQSDYK